MAAVTHTQRKSEPERGRSKPFFAGGSAVQAKLRVGTPGDRYEQEADRAADGAVHGRGPMANGGAIAGRLTPTVQRMEDDEAQATPMEAEARQPLVDELQLQEEEEAVQARPAEAEEEEVLQTQAEEGEEELQTQSEEGEEELQTQAEEGEEELQTQSDEGEEELQTQAEEGEEELQTQAEEGEEELQTQSEEEPVQAQEEEEAQARASPASGKRRPRHDADTLGRVERRLRAARGLGNPIPEDVRMKMQARFGADLSGVRIHTDALAVQLTRALRAQAFAHGRDIYFNQGKFAPGTPSGDHLLAHELAHTVQQGSVKQDLVQMQPEEGQDNDPDTLWVRPESLEAIRLARTKQGLINTKLNDADGNRIGYEHVQEIFRTAFGGDTIHPKVIQKITMVPDPAGGPGKKDALPHWCGLFTWWALKTAGVPLPDWKIGMNMLEIVEPRPPGTLPQKGDIAYRHKNQHFALISAVESSVEAEGKSFNAIRVRAVNGNTAGSDNLGGQVQETWEPIANWNAFFNPLAKMPLPDVPLIQTTRHGEDAGAAPPATPTPGEEKAADDPGPTDVSALEGDVAPTAEATAGSEAEIALDMPDPAPLPPVEPVAKVEKTDLSGSSDQAMVRVTNAGASSIAATGPDVSGSLDTKVAAEQKEAADTAPALKAQTGGDIDPGVTPADQIPIPAGANVGDGINGPSPGNVQVTPHQNKGPAPTNTETEKLMDKQPEGGFLAWLKGAIGNLMSRIRTSDPGISTSAGERQNVKLEGDSDVARMDRQKDEGAGQLRTQRDTQTQAFRNHPGQSNIKPRQIDEARTPALSKEPAARPDPLAPSSDAGDYVAAELPKDVRAKADTDMAPKLAPGLDKARADTQNAASTRDSDSQREKETAAEKARKINEDADKQQKQAVLDGRQTVATQQGEGIAGAYEQVQQFSDDAAKEQTGKRKAIGDHVKTEEGKARKKLEDGEKEADDKKMAEEKKAADKKKELEKEQKKDSWWDRVANAVKKAVKAVTEAIDTIFTALREAVATIIKKAKEAAVGLINKARDWVVSKLNDFRDWAKSQVDKYLKDSFPGLAKKINGAIDVAVDGAIAGVNMAADAAIAGVEALADGLAAALDKILATFQGALKAAVQILGAVLTGDFAEALRIAIQAACDIAGIDSKPIFGFLERAGNLIGSILKAPLKFINNLMRAVGQGISMFGKNILAHLQKGLISWLTGAISETGITLPSKWDLAGIFSLVAQILGLTYANFKARVIKKYPKAATVFDVVEKGFALIMKLKDLDFSGLWKEVKERVANLKEMVIGGVKQWVITTIIKEGIIWLLSLTNPASAIVKALKVLFDMVMWLVERFNQIKDFVVSIYEAVAKIASGVIGPAAKAVENALSRALPVVISMVASFLGLGGIGAAIKKLLAKITAPINKAMDWVIDKVVGFAKKLLGKIKGGLAALGGKFKAYLWPKKKFTAENGESHTLYFKKDGSPMIKSTPTALSTFVSTWEKQNPASGRTTGQKAALKAAKSAVTKIKKAAPAIDKLENDRAKLAPAAGKTPTKAKQKKIDAIDKKLKPKHEAMLLLQTELSTQLSKMLTFTNSLGKAKERYKLEGLTGTYGTIPKMKGDNLTGDHQPQAAILKLLAAKDYFKNDPKGAEMVSRAGGSHADNAYVINLQGKRHAAGRTYGGKGTSTKNKFVADLKKVEAKHPYKKSDPKAKKLAQYKKLRSGSVDLLKGELSADVTAMRAVYSKNETDPIWNDVDKFMSGTAAKKKADKKTLVNQIKTQVSKGESVLGNQPMNVLKG